jgi:hypothetical protein
VNKFPGRPMGLHRKINSCPGGNYKLRRQVAHIPGFATSYESESDCPCNSFYFDKMDLCTHVISPDLMDFVHYPKLLHEGTFIYYYTTIITIFIYYFQANFLNNLASEKTVLNFDRLSKKSVYDSPIQQIIKQGS